MPRVAKAASAAAGHSAKAKNIARKKTAQSGKGKKGEPTPIPAELVEAALAMVDSGPAGSASWVDQHLDADSLNSQRQLRGLIDQCELLLAINTGKENVDPKDIAAIGRLMVNAIAELTKINDKLGLTPHARSVMGLTVAQTKSELAKFLEA